MENEVTKPNLIWLFFSLNGRIARQSYSLGILFLIVLLILNVIQLLKEYNEQSLMALLGLFLLATLAIVFVGMICLTVKRLHDINQSGFVSLLLFVPFLNWLFVGFLMFLPSDPIHNRYGAPPFSKPDNT